jgi:hypothetical protein
MKLLYNPYDLLVKPDIAHACSFLALFLEYQNEEYKISIDRTYAVSQFCSNRKG